MKRGFTLVELLVVIAIISILTIITAAQFQTAMKKANDVARKGDLSALSKALVIYYTDHGSVPLEINGVGSSTSDIWCSNDSNCEFKDATNYTYMKVLPKEKTTVLPPFCYLTSADKTKFALLAMLENKGDANCKMTGLNGFYTACGKKYCYAITSPNTSLKDDGTFN